jgi:hypothetical protein
VTIENESKETPTQQPSHAPVTPVSRLGHAQVTPRDLRPETRGVRDTPLPQRGGRSFRGLDEEGRELASQAYALWRDLAVERGNAYGDHRMCLFAGRQAVEATRWEDGLVVLAAIRQRMDRESSPRWIPEWARELGGQRRRLEHEISMRAERDALADVDPEVHRIMVAFGRAKSRDFLVSTASWTCVVCKQLTDGRCLKCSRALHQRGCPPRHECEAA